MPRAHAFNAEAVGTDRGVAAGWSQRVHVCVCVRVHGRLFPCNPRVVVRHMASLDFSKLSCVNVQDCAINHFLTTYKHLHKYDGA